MAALNFPSSPTLNQVYTANGWSWRWDGTTWVTNTLIVGPTGIQGVTGATGPIGITGATGVVGVTGATGVVAVAGSNTQVIFNDAGAYAGDVGLLFDKTTDTLTVLGPVVGSNIKSTTAYRLINRTIITNPTTSYTTPAGCTRIFVQMVAGGGGGGGVSGSGTTNAAAGGGGGSGSYAEKWFTVTASTAYTVAVGLGGTAGAATPTAGGTGGNTTFTVAATTVTCNGGAGGTAMTFGTTVLSAAGGAGGAISTNGDLNVPGTSAPFGWRSAGTLAISGNGAPSYFGGGAQGLFNGSAVGNTAAIYGSGGSGGVAQGSATSRAGGAGSNGVIIVWEYGI